MATRLKKKLPFLFPLVLRHSPLLPWYLAGGITAAQCVAAYQAIGAASLAASYENLANPGTGTLTTSAGPTAPTLTAAGWTFDGTQALKMPITVSAGYSMIFRYSGKTAGGIYVGQAIGATDFEIQQVGGTRYYDNGSQVSHAGNSAAGVIALTDYGYFNGISETAQMNGLGTADALGVGGNWTTTLNAGYTGDMQAVAVYNILLTQAQVTALTAAIAALT